MRRAQLIAAICRYMKDPNANFAYLGIGIRSGTTINRVAGLLNADSVKPTLHAVDINNECEEHLGHANIQFFHCDAMEYFSNICDTKFDFVFIDADHDFHTTYTHYKESYKYLKNEVGIIAFHDTWPKSKEYTDPKCSGDCYKLHTVIPNMFTFTQPHGVSIVRKTTKEDWRYGE